MEGLGQRLKEERERLGMTQAKFAAACGVGKTAQYTYEASQRFPGAEYLAAAESLGVDVTYLFSGMREGEKVDFDLAHWELFEGVFLALGYSPIDIKRFTKMIVPLLHDSWSGDDEPREQWIRAKLLPDVRAILEASPFVAEQKARAAVLDQELLATVLDAFDDSATRRGARIPNTRRAQAVALLYRAFLAAGGKVDNALVDETVSLATS